MMTNAYHSEIVQILLKCGQEGLPVAEISRFVYNKHADIFNEELTFDSIHQTLRCYMWRQIHYRHSVFRKVKYGVYALKDEAALQMDFDFDNPLPDFQDVTAVENESNTTIDATGKGNDPRQLLLFEDMF